MVRIWGTCYQCDTNNFTENCRGKYFYTIIVKHPFENSKKMENLLLV